MSPAARPALPGSSLRIDAVEDARVRDRLAQVVQPAQPGSRSARCPCRSRSAGTRRSGARRGTTRRPRGAARARRSRCSRCSRESDALAAADDLAVPLGGDHVHRQRAGRVVRVGLHVERLDRRREAGDHHRPPVERSARAVSSSPPKSSPKAIVEPLRLQLRDGVAVVDARVGPAGRRLELARRRARAARARSRSGRGPARRAPRRTPRRARAGRRSASTRPRARPSRTRSGGGGSWTSRPGRSARSSTPCRAPPRPARGRAGPTGTGRPCSPK